jgi:hypothetical protein
MRPPDALHGADADPDRCGHGHASPMGACRGGPAYVKATMRPTSLGSKGGMRDGRSLVPPQPDDAFNAKPFLPAPDDGLGFQVRGLAQLDPQWADTLGQSSRPILHFDSFDGANLLTPWRA